jgi:hypothetical protein
MQRPVSIDGAASRNGTVYVSRTGAGAAAA